MWTKVGCAEELSFKMALLGFLGDLMWVLEVVGRKSVDGERKRPGPNLGEDRRSYSVEVFGNLEKEQRVGVLSRTPLGSLPPPLCSSPALAGIQSFPLIPGLPPPHLLPSPAIHRVFSVLKCSMPVYFDTET